MLLFVEGPRRCKNSFNLAILIESFTVITISSTYIIKNLNFKLDHEIVRSHYLYMSFTLKSSRIFRYFIV
jgi:hypothetical protein